MASRVVITGPPCPAQVWEQFLGPAVDQRVISMQEVLANTPSNDPRNLSCYITEQLAVERPRSIICHGMGVPLTIAALVRLKRRGISWPVGLTVFNGALHNVSLWQASMPLKLQWAPMRRVIRQVEQAGGSVDPALAPYTRRIRALYRTLIFYRLAEKMAHRLGLEAMGPLPRRAGLNVRIQVIASPNDPYLPEGCVKALKNDLNPEIYTEIPYGHFPYSVPPERIRPLIERFEQALPTACAD